MANKCHTGPDKLWVCAVKGKPEGAFTVDWVDAHGNFEGVYSSDKIKGTCTGTDITIWRPATTSRYVYSGKFSVDRKRLKGTRTDAKKKGLRPKVEEEWEGVKTTT